MTEKRLTIHNPHTLPTMPYTAFVDFQGDFKHPMTSQALKKMKTSLITHGVFVPKFVWFDAEKQGNILDGHQTKQGLMSLEEDGWEIPGIPYVKITAETRKEAAEKLLQINSRYAQVNPETTWLAEFVEGTDDLVAMLDKVEIPELDLDSLLTSLDLNDRPDESTLDDLPPEPEHIVIKPGDLIELGGKHRLLCGDSTKQEDISKLMQNEKADLSFNDPPYNMQKGFENDSSTWEEYLSFVNQCFLNLGEVCSENFAVYWCGSFESLARSFLLFERRFKFCREIVWFKSVSQGNDRFPQTCEYLLYGEKGNVIFDQDSVRTDWREYNFKEGLGRSIYEDIEKHGESSSYNTTSRNKRFNADYKIVKDGIIPKNVWFIQNRQGGYGFGQSKPLLHVNEKPVDFCLRGIKPVTKQDSIVLDLFGGSGSTLIACEALKRKARLMEISEKYCQVTIERWCQVTGRDDISINGQPVSWADYSQHV